MLKSPNGIILRDQWDEGEFEKDIETVMQVDYDNTNTGKEVYIELSDVKGGFAVGSICIALSHMQAVELAESLIAMCKQNESDRKNQYLSTKMETSFGRDYPL